MKARRLTTAVLAALAGLTLTAYSASIGVNVGPEVTSGSNSTVLAPSDVAGVVAQQNWNNKLQGNEGLSQVVDSGGNLLTTTVQINTQWRNNTNNGVATPDGALMRGGLDHSGGNNLFATIVGVPYDTYDVIIYFDGGHSSSPARFGSYTATPSGAGASAAQSLNGYDDGTFNGTYIRETGGQDGNYILFENMSGANLEIRSDGLNEPTPRAPWNAFQIVDAAAVPVIPEVSSALLSILGLFGFIIRRKR